MGLSNFSFTLLWRSHNHLLRACCDSVFGGFVCKLQAISYIPFLKQYLRHLTLTLPVSLPHSDHKGKTSKTTWKTLSCLSFALVSACPDTLRPLCATNSNCFYPVRLCLRGNRFWASFPVPLPISVMTKWLEQIGHSVLNYLCAELIPVLFYIIWKTSALSTLFVI